MIMKNKKNKTTESMRIGKTGKQLKAINHEIYKKL